MRNTSPIPRSIINLSNPGGESTDYLIDNFVDGENGKNNAIYYKRNAVCLETQFYPNAANEANFKKPIFKAGEPYDATTIYRFSIK